MYRFDGIVCSHLRVLTGEKLENFFMAATAANPTKETVKQIVDPLKKTLERLSPKEPAKLVDHRHVMKMLGSKVKGFKSG